MVSSTQTFDRQLARSIGPLATIVTAFERSQSPATDIRRQEVRNAMAGLMTLARVLKIRIDPCVQGAFDNDVVDGRLVFSATMIGRNDNDGPIVRFFDPFDLVHRWHELAADADLSHLIRVYPEKASDASPLKRGVYLRITVPKTPHQTLTTATVAA